MKKEMIVKCLLMVGLALIVVFASKMYEKNNKEMFMEHNRNSVSVLLMEHK